VTDTKPLSFKPNPFEEEYLEKNNIGFSDFVHKSFYKAMKRDHFDYLNKIANKLFYVLIGGIFLSFTYIVSNLAAYWLLFFAGLFCIIFGFIGVGWEVRNGR